MTRRSVYVHNTQNNQSIFICSIRVSTWNNQLSRKL